MRRYWRLIYRLGSASLATQLAYRANFAINILTSLIAAAGGFFTLLLIVGDESIGGWTPLEATVILGVFTLVRGFIGTMLESNLPRIAEGVRTGNIDFVLLKPVDAQFFVSVRNPNLFRIPDLIIGLGMIIYGIVRLKTGIFEVILATLLIISAFVIVYSIWFILATTAFWFVRVENVTEIFYGVFRAAQFPISAFPAGLQIVFTVIIPITFITTVPSEAIVGRFQATSALVSLGIAALLTIISRLFWKFALRSYTSASS